MDFVKEELPGCQVKLNFAYSAADVDGGFKKVIADLNKRGQVRGFRPGKAPTALLIRHYGEPTIRNGVWYELAGDKLREELEALDLFMEPDMPEVEELEIVEGQPLEFSILCTLRPTVEIADLDGFKLFRPSAEADEEEIAKVLEDLRDTHAEETAVERDIVQEGDAVEVEMKVTIEGEEEPADELEQTLIVGKGTHFPPIDEKLPGAQVGETVELDVTYPADYHDEGLAGKSGKVVAKVLDIRERKLPELDDAFAQKVDAENLQTLDDLKAEIKRQIDGQKSEYSREELETQAAHELIRRFAPDVPAVMVEEIAQGEAEEFSEKLEAAGLSLEAFQDVAGIPAERYALMERMRARRLIQSQLILGEVIRTHELDDVEPTQIMEEAEAFAKERNLDARMVTQALGLQPDFYRQLRERVVRRKAYDLIIAAADLQDMAVEEYRSKREEILRLPDDGVLEAAVEPEPEASDEAAPEAPEASEFAGESGPEIAPEPDAEAPAADGEQDDPQPADEA